MTSDRRRVRKFLRETMLKLRLLSDRKGCGGRGAPQWTSTGGREVCPRKTQKMLRKLPVYGGPAPDRYTGLYPGRKFKWLQGGVAPGGWRLPQELPEPGL